MRRLVSLLLTVCLAATTAARAESFPPRPSPGDAVCGRQRHRCGCAPARAPDGHTLLVATNATHSANPAGMIKSVPHDAVKDFAPAAALQLVRSAGQPALAGFAHRHD